MKILIAMPRPEDRIYYGQSFEEAGHTVLEAEHGNAAIALAELYEPDVLILALAMTRRGAILTLEYLAGSFCFPVRSYVLASKRVIGMRHRKWLELLGATVLDENLKAEDLRQMIEQPEVARMGKPI